MRGAARSRYRGAMLTQDELIARIEAHLAATGETATAFGRRVARDGNLLPQLREGRSPRLRLVHDILAAIETPREGRAA